MATPEQAQTLRGRLMSADCPSRQVLRHVSSRWGLLVILALGEGGQMRFSELRSTIGRPLYQQTKWCLRLL
ncbi:winged helix-turn-helix transcriptional regulator [Pseudoroseicyclus sp. H15]